MKHTNYNLRILVCFCLSLLITIPVPAAPFIRGIYITQPTVENRPRFISIIHQAKEAGINSFVIDVDRRSRVYQKNIAFVESSGITYVARIVVFPHGGSHEQVIDNNYWQKKFQLAQYAIDLGAKEIQLDYIRYYTKQPPSSQNAKNINYVISWFKQRLAAQGVPLQIAVFGETSFGESKNIGQNVRLFADNIDVLAPMLYPSHFEPFMYYSPRPYQTIFEALRALRNQFDGVIPFRVYAYIETSNYRYKMSPAQRINYIKAQIKAVDDAGVDGWYAWSAGNKYAYLFGALR